MPERDAHLNTQNGLLGRLAQVTDADDHVEP
jgi:hypothetical protein